MYGLYYKMAYRRLLLGMPKDSREDDSSVYESTSLLMVPARNVHGGDRWEIPRHIPVDVDRSS